MTPLATTGAPSSATPQGQLPPQTQAHMPTQSPTSLQVKTQGGAAQLQLQQSPQLISMSGLSQPVQVRLAEGEDSVCPAAPSDLDVICIDSFQVVCSV